MLDERTVNRINGPAWAGIRPIINRLTGMLLAVSPTARGELTTTYVKFSSDETVPRLYAVLWITSSKETTLGLALPDDFPTGDVHLVAKPPVYAGLTKFVRFAPGDAVPDAIEGWIRAAFDRAKAAS